MRVITNCLLTILVIFIFLSCQKEVKTDKPTTGGTTGTIVNSTPIQGNVTGKIIDNNNNAVAGATVKAGNNTTTTDSRGLFRFNNIQLDKYSAVITVEKTGFFKGYRVFSASANNTNFIKLKLVPKTLIGSIDAIAGGSVSLPDNSKITLPASGVVVRSNSQSYSGSVKVYAAVIDPTSADISQIVPGSFQGTDANNYRVILTSFGMLAVELEGNSGEQLQIATGKTAKLRFTIPSSLRSTAPATIPLWSVDETTGLWKQEGSATKGMDYYEGDVSHFSFWNCDVSSQTVFLEMTIVTAEGPLSHVQVKLTRPNGASSYGYTDSSGHVGGQVPKNEALTLEVLNTCSQAIYTQNVGPFSTNTNLGTITVTLPPVNTLQITGSVVNCSNQPVPNGNVLVYFEGQLYNRSVNNGNFSLTITRCSNSTGVVEIVAVDNVANQQSISPWTGSASTGTINTGSISACGVSSVSFIDYSVDGTNYSLSTATPGDSIRFYGSGSSGTNQTATAIFGYRVSQPNMNISFYTQGAAVGTFPINLLSVNQYDSASIVIPFNINITTYGLPGQFIEGNLTGQIRDISNNLHNVAATFRVRRN
ncbi:MAG: carboxypeptidase regulatory-like domain-containing protein [Bacteroidetes bacterium]|nr:MAG: carboxypeptidase regulatory-like domain-containing protein [Bacteroidota bacterium]